MSKEKILEARKMLSEGRYEEVVKEVKPLLNLMPDNDEIKQILTEAQEGIMLRLQLVQKISQAKNLISGGDKEGSLKILDTILKVDPTNPEANRLVREIQGSQSPQEPTTKEGSLEELEPFDLSFPEGGVKKEESKDYEQLESLEPFVVAGLDEGTHQQDNQDNFPKESLKELEQIGSEEETLLASREEAPFSFGNEGSEILKLVSEGKQLLKEGKYQEAVDVLTRVFILDEENVEASSLIEEAKAKLLEKEQEANLVLNEAISFYDTGNFDKAKELLNKVLEIIPGHREAQFYLKEIEEKSASSSFELETPIKTEESSVESFSFETPLTDDLSSLVKEEKVEEKIKSPLLEEIPHKKVAPPPKALEPKKEVKKIPYTLIVIVVVALALVSGAFYFVPKMFSKVTPKTPAQTIPKREPKISRQEIQQPIVKEEKKRSVEEIILDAKIAMQEKQYEKAISLYEEALKVGGPNLEIKIQLESAKSLREEQKAEEARTQNFINEYEKSVKYFKMGEYGEAVRIGWRLIYPKEQEQFAQKMGKAEEIKKIIRNGYYNWAVRDLKTGNVIVAISNLKDLLDFDPRDSKAREVYNFANKYKGKNPDESYKNYVQNLTYRQIGE